MHLTQIFHVVMTQIIDCLQFETHPCPLHNFRVAKSTSFLSVIVLCTWRFTHMQSLTAYLCCSWTVQETPPVRPFYMIKQVIIDSS